MQVLRPSYKLTLSTRQKNRYNPTFVQSRAYDLRAVRVRYSYIIVSIRVTLLCDFLGFCLHCLDEGKTVSAAFAVANGGAARHAAAHGNRRAGVRVQDHLRALAPLARHGGSVCKHDRCIVGPDMHGDGREEG